jgi:hypothetical protein
MKLFTPESWTKLSTSLEQATTLGIPYELELETVTSDGSNGWMWVMGEPIKDTDGNITGLWGAAQDITERIKSEKEILKVNDELTAASEELGAMNEELEAMNGELRATMEDLEVLNKDLILQRKRQRKQMQQKARTSANSLLVLVNDILDHSRIEAGKMELVKKTFKPRDLISEVLSLFRISASASGLSLEAIIDEDVPEQLSGILLD